MTKKKKGENAALVEAISDIHVPKAARVEGAAAEWVNQAELELWAENPRDNEGAVPKVVESIKRFGFVAPVVVWGSQDQLVAGHTRLKAYRAILAADPTFVAKGAPGPGMVPVRYAEFENAAEARAYAIADNRLNYEADWDYAKLVPMLEEIKTADETLLVSTGFDPGELDALMRSQWSPDFEAAKGGVFGGTEGASGAGAGGGEAGSSTGTGRTLSFDEAGWELLKRTVQKATGAGDEPSDIAAGLLDLCRELK